MSTTTEVLRRARELISTPERWTKHVSARDANGTPTDVWSGSPVCFCALGAIDAVEDDDGESLAAETLRQVLRGPVTKWNDDPSRTHAEVLAAFDKAIELSEAESVAEGGSQ